MRIKYLYCKENKEVNTVSDVFDNLYGDTYGNAVYRNKECTIVYCGSSRRLSLNTMIKVVKGYFPKLKSYEVLKELLSYKRGHNRFYIIYCSDIKKYTITLYPLMPSIPYLKTLTKKGKGNLLLYELIDKLNMSKDDWVKLGVKA